MNKSEAKFHNTAVKMDDALVLLLEHKEFKDISIMDVCEKAGVNRSTFYAHYENLYDLLKETQERAVSEFFVSFGASFGAADFSKMTADELVFISPQYLVPYLSFIKKTGDCTRSTTIPTPSPSAKWTVSSSRIFSFRSMQKTA